MARLSGFLLAVILLIPHSVPAGQRQDRGEAVYKAFLEWKGKPENSKLKWAEALDTYRKKLKSDGLSEEAAESAIRLVTAYDEAELYNDIYAKPPHFNTKPSQILIEAIKGLPPGEALDVGMGQGRNSIYLARNGWKVTGFDVAEVGVKKAEADAVRLGLAINAIHAADEEFDFGQNRWDLVAIIYAIEKRSVFRVRQALKPGGIVVIEASLTEPGGYPFGFESQELLKIFRGFRILKYEERLGVPDFGPDRKTDHPIVDFIAQKPH